MVQVDQPPVGRGAQAVAEARAVDRAATAVPVEIRRLAAEAPVETVGTEIMAAVAAVAGPVETRADPLGRPVHRSESD